MPCRQNDHGVFIAVEGPDGGGKSTQAEKLSARLQDAGKDVLLVREPGGTPLGERVREVLLDPELKETGVRAELFLFMACRAQLVAEVIRPALGESKVVISDRFLLSTLVYQGVAGGIAGEEIRAVAAIATRGLQPVLTLVIDVPAEIGLARVGEQQDRMERKGLEFHQRIRQGYLDLADDDQSITVIDGAGPAEAVAEAVWKAVQNVIC